MYLLTFNFTCFTRRVSSSIAKSFRPRIWKLSNMSVILSLFNSSDKLSSKIDSKYLCCKSGPAFSATWIVSNSCKGNFCCNQYSLAFMM